jgi:ribosomal protein L18
MTTGNAFYCQLISHNAAADNTHIHHNARNEHKAVITGIKSNKELASGKDHIFDA